MGLAIMSAITNISLLITLFTLVNCKSSSSSSPSFDISQCRVLDLSHKLDPKAPYNGVVYTPVEYQMTQRDAILMMNSGYDKYFYDSKKFLGTHNLGDWKSYHFPAFAPEVGAWLLANRRIRSYGVDTIAFDSPLSTKNHQGLLGAGIPGMENMANLGRLPPRGATIFLAPTKIGGGTGAWTRAFAIGWDGPDDPCRIAADSGGNLAQVEILHLVVLVSMFVLLSIQYVDH